MREQIARQHFLLTHPPESEDAVAPDSVDRTIERFRESKEWMAFLAKAIGPHC